MATIQESLRRFMNENHAARSTFYERMAKLRSEINGDPNTVLDEFLTQTAAQFGIRETASVDNGEHVGADAGHGRGAEEESGSGI